MLKVEENLCSMEKEDENPWLLGQYVKNRVFSSCLYQNHRHIATYSRLRCQKVSTKVAIIQ